MKYSRADLAAKFKKFTEGSNPQPLRFAAEVLHRVGVVDAQGDPVVTDKGLPTIDYKGRKDRPEDFNIAVLTEAMLGPDWKGVLGLESQGTAFPVKKWLREEGAAGVPPGTFLNISAWSSTVAGLLGAKVLEGYEMAPFMTYKAFGTENAVVWGGTRLIDVIGPMRPAREVGPGESHPDIREDELWVQGGPLKKYGFKILILKETAFGDITGGKVLQKAQEGGETLAFRDNELALDVLTGTTQNFNLGTTRDTTPVSYNTYVATAGALFTNDHVNPLTDWTTFQNIENLSTGMLHPVTQVPINVDITTLFVPSTLETYAKLISTADRFDVLNQPGNPVPGAVGTFPSARTQSDNPYRNRYTIVADRWLWFRHQAAATGRPPEFSAGLGLVGNNINRYYAGDPKKFARRIVGWEANTVALNPNDFAMADQGIIAGQVGNIALMYQVTSPWHMIRCKVS